MSKVMPLENDEEAQQAWSLACALQDARDLAPGWMGDEAGVDACIARLERAVSAYERKHPDLEL